MRPIFLPLLVYQTEQTKHLILLIPFFAAQLRGEEHSSTSWGRRYKEVVAFIHFTFAVGSLSTSAQPGINSLFIEDGNTRRKPSSQVDRKLTESQSTYTRGDARPKRQPTTHPKLTNPNRRLY